jgi:hypothetical protein
MENTEENRKIDRENMEEYSEMIWKIWKKGKSNSDKIGKIWKNISFHYFLLYFPNFPYHLTFQLTFFPYFPVICPFPAILFSLSVSYNLIIFYEQALSLVICPFPAILFSLVHYLFQ